MTQAIVGLVKPVDFPKKLQKKLLKKVKTAVLDRGEVKAKDLNDYLTEEIKDEFDAFTTSWVDRTWRKWGPSKKTKRVINRVIKKVVISVYRIFSYLKCFF